MIQRGCRLYDTVGSWIQSTVLSHVRLVLMLAILMILIQLVPCVFSSPPAPLLVRLWFAGLDGLVLWEVLHSNSANIVVNKTKPELFGSFCITVRASIDHYWFRERIHFLFFIIVELEADLLLLWRIVLAREDCVFYVLVPMNLLISCSWLAWRIVWSTCLWLFRKSRRLLIQWMLSRLYYDPIIWQL